MQERLFLLKKQCTNLQHLSTATYYSDYDAYMKWSNKLIAATKEYNELVDHLVILIETDIAHNNCNEANSKIQTLKILASW